MLYAACSRDLKRLRFGSRKRGRCASSAFHRVQTLSFDFMFASAPPTTAKFEPGVRKHYKNLCSSEVLMRGTTSPELGLNLGFHRVSMLTFSLSVLHFNRLVPILFESGCLKLFDSTLRAASLFESCWPTGACERWNGCSCSG